MKRLLTVFVALWLAGAATAQTYTALWKQAAAASEKDLPKTELAVMRQIVDKAEADKNYGHLLAAQLRSAMLQGSIVPDSIAPMVRRMETQLANEQDPTLRVMTHAVLGTLYKENPSLALSMALPEAEDSGLDEEKVEADYKQRMKTHFLQALAKPDLLASLHAPDYAPLTVEGTDGTIFGHDMLHVVGFACATPDAFRLLHDYYSQAGNRAAACLCAFKTLELGDGEPRLLRKSRYIQSLDSLVNVYHDLSVAGELAIARYDFMKQATDITDADRYNYLNYAISQWGTWARINALRNEQKELTRPSYDISDYPKVWLPERTHTLRIQQLRNIQQLTLTLSRLNITADNDYDVNDPQTLKMLKTKVSALHQKSLEHRYVGQPAYKVQTDSFEVAGLPLGAYLLEVSSDNADIKPIYEIIYVSDLALMTQQLPTGQNRYVVVSATTGQPVNGATIRIRNKAWKQQRLATLKTDQNGEAMGKSLDGDIYVYTERDKYTPENYTRIRRVRYAESDRATTSTNVYTDRALYRPGQSVHVTVIQYTKLPDQRTETVSGKELTFTLRNANYRVVAEAKATTDEYGTAFADFQLPSSGLVGHYSVCVGGGRASFRVEEYKRPTFEVVFPEVNERYAWGDTVVVKATAKTYSGMPVQGAKVSYTVDRRSAYWWWRNREADAQVHTATATTRDDGTFDVVIPLTPSEEMENGATPLSTPRFYTFNVQATVADLSGESHAGELSLPLGTQPTAFTSSVPDLCEKDSLRQLTFSYLNASGHEIAASVSFRIDQQPMQTAQANKPVQIADIIGGLSSGQHELYAFCGQDTIRQTFTLFSIHDRRPARKTTDWHYQTSETFPADGSPVYVQIGSSENGAHIVYSLVAADSLLEQGTIELSDSILTRTFTYRPEYKTGLVLDYCFVKEGREYKHTVKIERPLPDLRLNVSWQTFRNRLTPGQKEEWTLQVTTPDGHPAKAQLMSVLYDKSLDQIMPHQWNASVYRWQSLPGCYWSSNSSIYTRTLFNSAMLQLKNFDCKELAVDAFDTDRYFCLDCYGGHQLRIRGYQRGRGMGYAKEGVMPLAMMKMDGVAQASVESAENDVDEPTEEVASVATAQEKRLGTGDVQVRENLNETAFFYPAMETDKNGVLRLKFTLPESVTTWRFMGLAHDGQMRSGLLTDDIVARKTIMIQPNQPRFLREGDKATLMARVFNSAEKKVSGMARMQIIDPETGKTLMQQEQKYTVEAGATAIVSFEVTGLQQGIYIYKVTAQGSGYSDGEQHYLPVLSAKELVTRTLPFTIHEAGKRTLDLSTLYTSRKETQAKAADHATLTIEYTNNPAWLMIQALPTVSNPSAEDAISLMTAVYSNTIARHLLQAQPAIKQVVTLWQQEQGKETTLESQLQKNQELKEMVLSETPWLLEADKETAQRRALINYFDENQVESRIATEIDKLKALQRTDGSFSWWKDMPGSRYMTTAVAMMMVRLNKMAGKQQETASILARAFSFLHKKAADEVREMKKEETRIKEAFNTNGKEKDLGQVLASVMPSESAIDYLYILALDGDKLSGTTAENHAYLISKMANRTCDFTIYGKAHSAVILARNGHAAKANDYLQSIDEYTVYKEETGRYFDTPKAYYSWRDYKIPTQVAAIEALALIRGVSQGETNKIEEMKRWLLMSKRTQGWDTPVNCVDAVYAFLGADADSGKSTAFTALEPTGKTTLSLDGKTLPADKASAGLGYVKTTAQGTHQRLTIDKQSQGTSWGAVYAQYTLPAGEVAKEARGIKVVRTVKAATQSLAMGQKVTVTITITADRDYDFVQVTDRRAACLEPVNQTSGYQSGYYVAPKDNETRYYFSQLAKGTHVISTEYYIDRQGIYQSGTCSVQCAYAPEFKGTAEAYQMAVAR